MLEFQKRVQKLKKNIEPLLSKEDGIPLENESIDLLITINTLHEFGEKDKTIEEMRRVLKRFGKL